MERVTLVMAVFDRLPLTRACLESLRGTTEPFRLVVVDNGSSDETPRFFERFAYPYPLHFERNATNQPVIATLNRAWRLAETEFLCILHNDTEMLEPTWLTRLLAPLADPDVGVTGLYGVKRIRRDGRFVGRTIVHSLAEGPTVRPEGEEVAVVDSVCMCLPRRLMEDVGGLDEGYGFYHGLDRDLSFAVRERGRRCVTVHAPFLHHGGATRTHDFVERPDHERADLALRRAVLDRFVAKYHHRLPCDVRPVHERAADWLQAKLLRRNRRSPST
jgi:GT2 family glycosyltransferase